MARLILDTGVIIAAVRGRIDLDDVSDTEDIALPTIAAAAYLTGTELDHDDERAASQRAFLDELLHLVPVVDYDMSVARAHARLVAETQRQGDKHGAHDLIVAASAMATERTVLTTDVPARFEKLTGVHARVIDP